MTTVNFEISPIDARRASELRGGATVRFKVDAEPGFPCRLCLRDAKIGETVLLVSYDPFRTNSPYRSASPIFLHETPCVRLERKEISKQQSNRLLSLRAFNADEFMLEGKVVQGGDLETAVGELFADASVDFIHVHNAGPGCWALRIDRSKK